MEETREDKSQLQLDGKGRVEKGWFDTYIRQVKGKGREGKGQQLAHGWTLGMDEASQPYFHASWLTEVS